VLFSEPKIPQCIQNVSHRRSVKNVSVLFSEPKIPQCSYDSGRMLIEASFQCSSASRKFLNDAVRDCDSVCTRRFSALQRAENSSIVVCVYTSPSFQSFSALQRAENSSMHADDHPHPDADRFQCSSASRKFLNRADARSDR